MIVCICRNINERAAREFLKDNSVADFAKIVKHSGSTCQKCTPTIKKIKQELDD